MNIIKIVCPKCNAEAKLSLVDTSYFGPRRCWKCHEYFTIRIENNRLMSCESLSKEEYEKQEASRKAAEKAGINYTFSPPSSTSQKSNGGIEFIKKAELQISQKPLEKQLGFFEKAMETSRGGIEFSSQKQPETRQTTPEKPKQEFFKPNIPHTTPKPAEPDKPGIYPPDKPNTFVPIEDVSVEPVKSPKAKEKPFRPPIPPAT